MLAMLVFAEQLCDLAFKLRHLGFEVDDLETDFQITNNLRFKRTQILLLLVLFDSQILFRGL